MDGVVNDAVVARAVPRVAVPYQAAVHPLAGVADRVTVPEPHLDAGLPKGAAGNAFTAANTVVLVADKQPVAVILDST
jgi:hypothetical protein